MRETNSAEPAFWSREMSGREMFRQIYSDATKIIRLSEGVEAMTLGPSIVTRETAIEDQWIGDKSKFKPDILVGGGTDAMAFIEGDTYNSYHIMLKLGGNKSAAKDWLGNVRFKNNDGRTLRLELKTNGCIHAIRTTDDSRWRAECVFGPEEMNSLGYTLGLLKEYLGTRKLGSHALKHST